MAWKPTRPSKTRNVLQSTAVWQFLPRMLPASAATSFGSALDVANVGSLPKRTQDDFRRLQAESGSLSTEQGIKLTYFKIAGAAEKVRLALALAGEDFTDERVKFDEWFALKPQTPFGQLPIMSIDGGAPLTQSEAMLREIGRRHPELYPPDKALCIDELMGLSGDLARVFTPSLYVGMIPSLYGYHKEYAKTEAGQATIKQMREGFVSNDLPLFLGYFAAWLDSKGDGQTGFMCGAEPTIVDCTLVPQLQSFTTGFIEHFPTTSLDAYPSIIAYISRFLALPRIKAWYEKQEASKVFAR